MSALLKPPVLNAGDVIGITAPSGPFDRPLFDRGVAVLRDWGLEPVHGADLFAREGYLAGPDARRASDLQHRLEDPNLRAIFCARGGYGATRLLPELDASPLSATPKLFVGFSDITALHSLFLERAGVATVHGPVVTNLGGLDPRELEPLRRLLFSPEPLGTLTLDAPWVIREGRASGRLKGGNLAVLTSLLGTPYQPDLREAVLFFEDVGERPYRIDRMLTQLSQSGALASVRAILVGDLTRCVDPPTAPRGPLVEAVVSERLANLGVPVLGGFPAGHGTRNHPLPLGLNVTVDATAGQVLFEEGFGPR